MSLSETCIRRPVLSIVLSTVLILLGAVSLALLGIREFPAVDAPIISVSTSYPGASAEIIDSQITEPLEQVINGIDGIRVISSNSAEGRSNIRVEFDISADLERAANDVRDKVSQAIRRLPVDADPPTVEKADADAEPILFLALNSDRHSILEISHYATNVVKERLQTIPGVSTVRIFGEKRYAMRLWLDPVRMAAHHVTPLDVQRALTAQNVDLPSGRIEGATTELTIRTFGRLTTPEEFARMIIRQEKGRIIELRDVGEARLEAENTRHSAKIVGRPNIGIAVVPQPNTDAIAIADEVHRRLAQIRADLPEGFALDLGYDFTTSVRRAITEVEHTLLIAFSLVALIIYVFLRDWRATAIPVLAIPVSLVASFFVMYLAGFTINVLTLVALVLAIGLVVDDAIVVLENIYTKIEDGVRPYPAAVHGIREIFFAVISTTITLATVFVPILFMSGLTGRLFREFGVVVAGAVIVSSFVALTLTPMLCRFILKHERRHSRFHRWTEPFFGRLTEAYRRSLGAFLRLRWLSWPVFAACAVLIIFLGRRIPSELAPLEDRSNIRINFSAPEGATYEYTAQRLDAYALQLADAVPEIHRTFSIAGWGGRTSNAMQNVYLVAPDERPRSQQEIFDQISDDLLQFDALFGRPSQPPTIGSRFGGQPVQFVLKAPDVAALRDVLPKFLDAVRERPEIRFADFDFKITRPEISVRIDRAKAAELDISIADIARTLQLAFGETRFGYFIMEGRQYQVIGQLARADRNKPDDLRRVHVRSRSGQLVPLDNLVTLEETVGPPAIYRFNRFVAATLSGTPAPGYTLGQALQALDEVAAATLPEKITTDLAGQSRDFLESSRSLLFAFLFALVLIYLVLAAQFESFRDPLIILLTVPLSIAGAVLTLWLTGYTLNVFSQIGIIMLIGLVTKNGILIVEFANQRRHAGLDIRGAVHDAAVRRFRPILMTSLSTILGILPIALNLGTASGSRTALGAAVVGGLIFSGFLTLYVIPAMYTYLATKKLHHDDEHELKAG